MQHLCGKGRLPEALADAAAWKRNRLWTKVDGRVDPAEFVERARAAKAAFDPRRWYCDGDDLIHAADATYALTNQWGTQTFEVMKALERMYPNDGVSVSASE